MKSDSFAAHRVGWRWLTALALYLCALISLQTGVSFSERPEVQEAGFAAQVFYCLGIFVLGGLDLGIPQGGPQAARLALWLTYFGAPLLTASAVIETAFRMIAPTRWQLRRVSDQFIIFGNAERTAWCLRLIRRQLPDVAIVVVLEHADELRETEYRRKYGVTVVVGDITQDYLLDSLQLQRARRILLLGEDDFQGYEAASKMIRRHPGIGAKILLHCLRLRFMHDMQETRVGQQCTIFNLYQLAAVSLVRKHLINHFHRTENRDVVVIAGFGRFGQSVLTELLNLAADEIETVAIIDTDAERRIMVADEQGRLGSGFRREVVEGDISHPEVWQRLAEAVDLSKGEPTVIIGTGDTDENLRTALWLRRQYPKVLIVSRSILRSEFAEQVGADYEILSISLAQLIEDNLPVEFIGRPGI